MTIICQCVYRISFFHRSDNITGTVHTLSPGPPLILAIFDSDTLTSVW